ncbi:serine/threonine-protein kinase [Neorhodopirellula pilleata]|uniref:Serine/threonine-protein kinase PknB n=1 Tax=Neorhodopirellula pilleata TaxID=2714738 RepID=A0A5C6A2Q5_9BACT|nr:serine/threonine-protein kinase [Neorhodopirellula pilleata]TWT93597.1 Serine/threonine-protein kinase PknB [Neorhodopirellula pilleata]
MDAARYQKIQDLFWESESIEPSHWRSFLEQQVGDDPALIDEVISLLREHNPDAAQVEGSKAQAVQLPPTIRGNAPTEFGSGRNPQPSNDSSPRSDVTIPSSQRTHAAPREKPQSRRKPTPQGSKTLTAAGGVKPSWWSWLPIWLALWVAGTASIWIAAWFVGRSEIQSDWNYGRRVLPITMHQARARIELQLLRERERTRQLATGRVRRILELIDSEAVAPFNDPTVDKILKGIGFLNDPNCELAVWDDQFRCIVATPSLRGDVPVERLEESLTRSVAPLIRTCLQGKPVFCGFGFARLVPLADDRRPMGWMIPVYRNSDSENSESSGIPIGVVMLLQYSIAKQLQDITHNVSGTAGVDAYLIDRQGIMQTESRLAQMFSSLPSVAGRFRVAEYDGFAPLIDQSIVHTNAQPKAPLTIAAATLIRMAEETDIQTRRLPGQHAPEDTKPYPNYIGIPNQGTWRWFPLYDFGLIVERPWKYPPDVFEMRRINAYTTPLAHAWPMVGLYSLLALPFVSTFTWWHHRRMRAIEAKNRPLSRYGIKEELGAGGMGVVYRAEHIDLGRDVAIKLLRSDCQAEDDRQRFDREARLASTLSCPHSVTIYDYGHTHEGDAFCVMELLNGITLAEVVARSGPQPPGRVVWIMQQICQSILEAHGKGLMHRDLKPQNVMLRLDPVVGDWAVVFDFGLAKPIAPDRDMFQTAETIWAGTPMYMAPERFREPSKLDPRSDIYSIGCIAYYLLAGNPPFAECDPESMFGLIMTQLPIEISTHREESIDAELNQWVRRCMAKNKHERSSDIQLLNRELQSISERLPWSRSDAESWWSRHDRPPIDGDDTPDVHRMFNRTSFRS